MSDNHEIPVADAAPSTERAGFRLERLEVLNWGTFHQQFWPISPDGENLLLTGDIGSGKSTLVDAITTLLVPPQKVAYNKAAGAESRERTLRSYVLGYYKAERAEASLGARPVALRDASTYSVILARFANVALGQTITLAQVFWMKDPEGQPARMFVVADRALTIKEHFAAFGPEIAELRKRLRKMPGVDDVWDSFPPYAGAFRRRLGIDNEQALELFHQTVSLKSVGNLTDFVRQHMLQSFPVEDRLEALISHFDDLNRAHDAVLRAKAQVDMLSPLVASCDEHEKQVAIVEGVRCCRDALRPWFAGRKAQLLEARLAEIDADLEAWREKLQTLRTEQKAAQERRDEVVRAIATNGGDRISAIEREIEQRGEQLRLRQERAQVYDGVARALDFAMPTDADAFVANRREAESLVERERARESDLDNAHTEASVEMRKLRDEHDAIETELESLRRRRSNIPARILAVRTQLCRVLGVDEAEVPFAGELLQVRPADGAWEGAIERVLHSFGLSLLVPDALYANVAQWVEMTHLNERLVYYRVRTLRAVEPTTLHPDSLVQKLEFKPDSVFRSWLEAEVARRFDYACCDTLDQFRRESRAITRAGQTKARGEYHEKDDRHRIDDRSRYVLGWSNTAKVRALEQTVEGLRTRIQGVADTVAGIVERRSALRERLHKLARLTEFARFDELDWKPLALEIDRLGDEKRSLEAASDVLRELGEQKEAIERGLVRLATAIEKANAAQTRRQGEHEAASKSLADCRQILEETPERTKEQVLPLVSVELGDAAEMLTLANCDARQSEARDDLQKQIDTRDKSISRLAEKIVSAMKEYATAYPLDTQEVDASVESAAEFRAILSRLETDDLPRFEQRFKELLNENTIREVANFQSQLHRERQNILERIDVINRSLRDIDYNEGRYIVLDATPSTDVEVRDFQQQLRACTEGALTGSEEEAYSEKKFLHVRQIIERFRGRDGTTELDGRWTRKVTDVRNWFVFSASERWREDDSEHEHYTDSGGKSGGQKEKLAYTVLAASLAYQFGLDAGTVVPSAHDDHSERSRARTFRFVVIDEAFGRSADTSTRYALELFARLKLQLLIVTPLQKIHVIEPYVSGVAFVYNEDGRCSIVRNLTIGEYRAGVHERAQLRERGEPRDGEHQPARTA